MHSGRGYPRAFRVNEVLRQIIGEELERLADADERLRLVTVTAVDTSGDLRTATVFLAEMDDETFAALDERRAQLQRTVGRQVRMKRTPRLSFAADPAVREGERVEAILRRLGAARDEQPARERTGGRTEAGRGTVRKAGDARDSSP
ncbi:MAG TPA: 30S ribosome-binding factor RbfA [Acidimicrobiales bacterium]|nr:30S ribosome-binding factor RbfA [Acidimicrobiales bacterium]